MNNTNVFRKDEWLVDIYVHILLVLIVLSLAFWLFLSKVETKSLQGEVKNQIGKLIDNFTINVSGEYRILENHIQTINNEKNYRKI